MNERKKERKERKEEKKKKKERKKERKKEIKKEINGRNVGHGHFQFGIFCLFSRTKIPKSSISTAFTT